MGIRVTTELARTRRPAAVPVLSREAQLAVDAAIGAVGLTVGAAVVAVRTAHRLTAPVTRLLWRPPLVPTRMQPATVVAEIASRGRADRVLARRRAEVLLDALVPAIAAAVVERLDLTRLVEQHVDLDQLVSTVDLDAAVSRVDLDAAVARVSIDAVLDRVDLDAVVARVDIDAVIDRVDLNEVASRLDVDAVVARADLDAAVARVDIDAVIDRVDLNEVASRLDVDAVVARADLDAAVARVDIDAVIDRVDLVGIVEEVLDVIDLPGIIRDSTGSMASETVRGVRMTGISADDAISKAVDRALWRRRRPQVPGAAP